MLEKFNSLFKATDMTTGTPWKQIILFTLPMLIGNVAQQLQESAGEYLAPAAWQNAQKEQ